MLGAVGTAAVALPVVFGLANVTPSRAQSQAQATATPSIALEYEVASFKPDKSDSGMMRIGNAADSFTAENVTVQMLVTSAYGIQDYQLSGAPSWINSERYDVNAKMDSSVADALQKLSQDDRNLARQKMLQDLLADRLKLTVRRESKELPVYTLVIGKNGSKLKEATPDEIATTAPGGRGGRGGRGMLMNGRGGSMTMTAMAVPMTVIIRMLSGRLGRPVLDKTGLTGLYDYALTWTQEDIQVSAPPGGSPSGAATLPPPESNGPTLQIAIEEQLGLKLESGKGPVEIIVIEHVERPSEN